MPIAQSKQKAHGSPRIRMRSTVLPFVALPWASNKPAVVLMASAASERQKPTAFPADYPHSQVSFPSLISPADYRSSCLLPRFGLGNTGPAPFRKQALFCSQCDRLEFPYLTYRTPQMYGP